MDYGRPDLADQLAAAYVVGTLRGAARRRFETLLPAHAALREAVREWQERLMPLTTVLPPEPPPARVWERIRTSVEGAGAGAGAPGTTTTSTPLAGIASRLAFWRGLAAFASVAAVALGLLLANPAPVQPPIVIVLSATGANGGGGVPASFVASISADGGALVTKPLAPLGLQADRALELWALPASGAAPRSLGLISASGATVVRKGKALEGAEGLAVSLEPPGGSPTGAPSGPVLYSGKLTS